MTKQATEAAPRASWAMIADALAGRGVARWAGVRSVRFDGPRATDANLAVLAEAGCLEHVEELHLASDQLTARGVAIALSLPALVSLRLEGVAAPELARCASSVRRLALFGCEPRTCAAVVGAVASLSEIELESVEARRDHGVVWRAMTERDLRVLRLAHVPVERAAMAAMLASSAQLETLLLDDVAGLDSDAFLAGRAWSALRALHWHRGNLAALGAHLPAQLAELSLRETSVAALDVGSWAARLTSLDCVRSSVSEAMAAHVDPRKLVHLGLASGDVALRTVAAMEDSPLRSLALGDAFAGTPRDAHRLLPRLPAMLESLALDRAWALDEALLRDVLRGECAPQLRALRLERLPIGNLDLGGIVSPHLRRVAIRDVVGAIEGLGEKSPLALTHIALEDVRVEDLDALLRRCECLASLHIANVTGFGAVGLRDALVHVGAQLVQLSLARFSADDLLANGDALTAARYPALAELHLDDTICSPRAFAHLVAADVMPALERLGLDCAPDDEQWLSVVARPASALHWIDGQYPGEVASLCELLRDPASGVADAVLHLRRRPR